ncbi:hypothetical protein ABZT47_30510 [Sphaerisporangium sp. NPDC005289]|uniref:hypothetical protein n=1 Tax=Sphaerisporangium sp. NPDC005289 TaxID=3155247 RepID=UPI0033BA27C2
MPRTLSDAHPGVTHEDEHHVTLAWEPFCADAEAGLCEHPDCDPQVGGEWMAACDTCDFLVMAPENRHDELWALSARHESDFQVGLGMQRLP